MANSRKPGPANPPMDWWVIPALTSGPLGFFDQGDPNVTTLLGDTPGPLGFNDANDPSIGPFGSALEYAMFLSAGPFDSSPGIDSAEYWVEATVSAKPSSAAWARTEQSRVPAWNPAASDRVMGNLLANSERFADNKSAPGMWDRITEKGKAVWDATGEAVDDAGRALRRAVTIDSPAEARARADAVALRRTQNQVAADLRAHGWGDNGLVCMRLGPTAMAVQPALVNPAYYDSFDQRIAWSTNDALQLYAGGALIDAVAIPILTAGGKLAVRFLSEDAKLSYGLRQELRSSLNADLRPPAKIDGLNQRVGGNKAADVVGQKIAKGDDIEPAQANRMSNSGGAQGKVKGSASEVIVGENSAIVQLGTRPAAVANEAMVAEGNQPAWLVRTDVVRQIVPTGTQYKMVVSEAQAQALARGESWFGNWATPSDVPSQAFARNNLSILPEFKPDVSYLVTVETTAPQTVNSGFAGPLGGYDGTAAQIEFLGAKNLRIMGNPEPLPRGR